MHKCIEIIRCTPKLIQCHVNFLSVESLHVNPINALNAQDMPAIVLSPATTTEMDKTPTLSSWERRSPG